jgi:hypothetical protein
VRNPPVEVKLASAVSDENTTRASGKKASLSAGRKKRPISVERERERERGEYEREEWGWSTQEVFQKSGLKNKKVSRSSCS